MNNLMLYKYLYEFNVGGGDEQFLFFTIGVWGSAQTQNFPGIRAPLIYNVS